MTRRTDRDDSAGAGLADLLRQYEAGLADLARIGRDELESQVEHLQALAETLALGRRLLRIYDEVKYLPPGRRARLKERGCVVRGHEVKGGERATIIRLDLKRHPYTLTFREPEVSYEDVKAVLDLRTGTAESSDLVCSILLELDVNEPGDGWTPRRVDAFVPGEWVRDVLEVSARLDPPGAPSEDLKKRFGLGRS